MYKENIVKVWKIKCIEKGTSLNAICKKVGIDREVLTRWERQEPKSLRLAKQIDEAIEQMP
jgi:transposase-like protein